ncbi:DUF721 domain-containing protein [Thalassococcus sp. CAU 1522]|uniref:DUF721 domain-containing protein n=1 Tax=Thalassococcus arenae TaxID=2851652 RepID=A0ABS6N802_9RHOB|nr:DciA family protein [Thalassococcus arenae]MBV2360151.1 DUF721 domain-containing protein [Thalassococcus arenae]
MATRQTTTFGFARTAKLLEKRIRSASESRGFAQSRLLTHWEEVAGADIAAISRPVEVSYSKGGFGATLILLTTGANAPVLEMQKEMLRARVNAVYGFNAIARIRVTQTAPTGFAEGQADFTHRTKPATRPEPGAEDRQAARAQASGITDEGLRAALERLGANVLSKAQTRG